MFFDFLLSTRCGQIGFPRKNGARGGKPAENFKTENFSFIPQKIHIEPYTELVVTPARVSNLKIKISTALYSLNLSFCMKSELMNSRVCEELELTFDSLTSGFVTRLSIDFDFLS